MEHQCLGAECGVVLMIPCTGQQKQRAENEALERKMKAHRETASAAITGAEKQVDALRAENERLKGQHDTCARMEVGLRAENQRLRAALEQIVRGWQVGLSAGDLHDIAKQTLSQS